ncbi:ras guanine nucleotide exchange factor domain-containing protein [Cokeromyces recurvatus]|uniref:ras guanine nucleotide exchange factor domain-containing protein n=1 Tax=Cokeromyces recurvatus TaxID=90255 RepID=UPI00221EDAC8|nr:ras guanine nucleotide exchange factor domain-containing protein [Cokeromyces recurvatus]KAI7898139.1 ras guanine nucleotide exchange factor domain-containing protein [Cokeromyces recurvatus]
MAAEANTLPIICRVRALYAFSSTEKSSLSFEKDEYIDVLTKLDSGWWDGLCGGNRGWFPSNYVKIVETSQDLIVEKDKKHHNPATTIEDDSDEEARTIKVIQRMNQGIHPTSSSKNHHSYYSGAIQPKRHRLQAPPSSSSLNQQRSSYNEDDSDLPEGWTLQIADDGITKFYFNKQTGGLRWNHPGIISDSDNDDSHPSAEEEFEVTSRPISMDKPMEHFDDFGKIQSKQNQTVVEHKHVNLMSYWTKRTTPQGKVYYGNSITNETTWNYDDIDLSTGRLKTENNEQINSEYNNKIKHNKSENTLLEEENMTWKTIASEIAHSVRDLNKSIMRNENTVIYRQKIAVIVDAVRLMLYASRSMDKDAPHMQDTEIKEPLRIVLSTLAKLILSAKNINDNIMDVNSKIQRDASDVLNAVRKFILVCQNKDISLGPINPKFVLLHETEDELPRKMSRRKSSTGTQSKAKYPLNQDLIVSLQTHAKQIVGSTDALCKASTYIYTLEQKQQKKISENENDDGDEESIFNEEQYNILDEKARSNVILLFQNLSSQIGNYLAILNDVDVNNFDTTQIQSLPEFRSNKQQLYNSIGLLFSAVQVLTDTHNELAKSVSSIEETVHLVEDTIENIFSNVVQMVGERKVWLMKNGENSNIREGDPISPVHNYFDNDNKKQNNYRNNLNESTSVAENNTTLETSNTLMLPRLYNRQTNQQQAQHRPSISTAATSLTLANLVRSVDNKALKRQFSFGHGINLQEDQSQFWFLGYDYAEGDIEFSQDKSVKGGTLRALVERLTLHDYIDMSFIANFLLTYRSFCTTEEFVDLLQERYNLAPPDNLTPEELDIWTDKKQKFIRLRVFNVMKNWLENYYNDKDEFILNKLQIFANTVICDSSSFSAEQLNRLIRKRRELDANGGGLKKLIPNTMNGPMPILPKNLQHIRLLDTDPLELARQLTIMDFKFYSSIRPIECLSKAWSKDGAENAENVKQSIDYCNRLTSWVSGSILSYKEAKKRVVVIKYWAQVANRCLEMNNYNTCMAILSAFDNSAIGRLKKTWELVSSRTSQSLAHIRKLMGSNRNFTEYREMIHSVNPPCIPFLGIYLQDLTFIEDGNPDFLKKSNNLINFAKQQKAAEVIREIKQFQSPPYIFQYVPEIQDYIKMQLETSRDVDYLYERSLELEPRAQTMNDNI